MNATPTAIDHETSSSATSNSGRSDTAKSETTQPSSVDEYESPIVTVNKEHVRVCPFAKYLKREDQGVLELQEAIATTLLNTSADTLMSFVDPMVPTFKAVFKGDKQLVIWRKGNAAFIGIFEHHVSMRVFGFEHLVGFAIGYDGSWRIMKGAGNAICEPKWAEVWMGRYKSLGGVNDMVVEYEHMEVGKAQRASMLAKSILEGTFWKCNKVVKTT